MTLPRPRDHRATVGSLDHLGGCDLVFEPRRFAAAVHIVSGEVGFRRSGSVGSSSGTALFAAVAYFILSIRLRVQLQLDQDLRSRRGTGYQIVQSKTHTGGIFGTGLDVNPTPRRGILHISSSPRSAKLGCGLDILMLYTVIIRVCGHRHPRSCGSCTAAGLSSTLAIQLFIVVSGVTDLHSADRLRYTWMSYGPGLHCWPTICAV